MQIAYESDSLTHFGVLGMRWGHRKQRPVGNGRLVQKTSSNKSAKKAARNQAKRKKILTDSRKQTLKAVGKTALKVAGGVAATAALGAIGSMSWQYAINNTPLGTRLGSTSVSMVNSNLSRNSVRLKDMRGNEMAGPVNFNTLAGGKYRFLAETNAIRRKYPIHRR